MFFIKEYSKLIEQMNFYKKILFLHKYCLHRIEKKSIQMKNLWGILLQAATWIAELTNKNPM